LENIAEAYAEMLVRGPRIKDNEETAKPEPESGEPATSYLDIDSALVHLNLSAPPPTRIHASN